MAAHQSGLWREGRVIQKMMEDLVLMSSKFVIFCIYYFLICHFVFIIHHLYSAIIIESPKNGYRVTAQVPKQSYELVNEF